MSCFLDVWLERAPFVLEVHPGEMNLQAYRLTERFDALEGLVGFEVEAHRGVHLATSVPASQYHPRMGRFMAAIYDRFMEPMEERCGQAWRHGLLRPLTGRILEIGAGTGRNLEHYGETVSLVLAEPDPHMRKRLERRVAEVRPGTRVEGWSVEALDCPDAAFDVVVSTLVLCSVADVHRALGEIRRVLVAGGTLVFLEHVLSDKPARRRWQRRIEPVWKRVAGNCHLCRETERALESDGFVIEQITRESARGALPIVRSTIRGRATRPA